MLLKARREKAEGIGNDQKGSRRGRERVFDPRMAILEIKTKWELKMERRQ
jgi:hypothetical protein